MMTGLANKQNRLRCGMRISTEAKVKCSPYSSIRDTFDSRGVMLNVSKNGSYITTRREFKPGSILVVRTTRYPDGPFSEVATGGFRSIFLAEVKWSKKIEGDSPCRYGAGLRYLD